MAIGVASDLLAVKLSDTEIRLKPGESKQWPVVFVIDPKLPKDVKTITLSYTFFEVAGGKVAVAPKQAAAVKAGS